jgi:putative addiction module component (TIGR02574 family)
LASRTLGDKSGAFEAMETRFDEIMADAMTLPLRDRVRLAQRLVSSLDDESETDVEVLWFVEAERRAEEIRTGQVEGINAEDAFTNARRAVKQ